MAATTEQAARQLAPRTRLIINADDFAFTPAVTAGILEAHHAGSVTSTSMMVHCPGWDDGVRQAKATPTLGIGLHLNLVVGAPLTTAPSLTDRRTGRFASLSTLTRRALTGALNIDEAEAECVAQLEALDRAGVVATHIDSHRHTHALPVLHRAVARVAVRRGLPLRRPVESHRRFPNDLPSQLHRGVIACSWRVTSVTAAVTRAPNHFIGVSMQGSEGFSSRLLRVLDSLPAGSVELMVHPGHVDDALLAVDGYTTPREVELTALRSAAVRDRLTRGDIALVNFGAL
ncbi:MAG: ChbG/HpnK family deacetylase [bacterium]